MCDVSEILLIMILNCEDIYEIQIGGVAITIASELSSVATCNLEKSHTNMKNSVD